jgi:hypothetical protein
MAITGDGGPHRQLIQFTLFNASPNPAKWVRIHAEVRLKGSVNWRSAVDRTWSAPEWLSPQKGFQLTVPIGEVCPEDEQKYLAQELSVNFRLSVAFINRLGLEDTQTFTRTISGIGPDASKPVQSVFGGDETTPQETNSRAEASHQNGPPG